MLFSRDNQKKRRRMEHNNRGKMARDRCREEMRGVKERRERERERSFDLTFISKNDSSPMKQVVLFSSRADIGRRGLLQILQFPHNPWGGGKVRRRRREESEYEKGKKRRKRGGKECRGEKGG